MLFNKKQNQLPDPFTQYRGKSYRANTGKDTGSKTQPIGAFAVHICLGESIYKGGNHKQNYKQKSWLPN